MRAFIGAGRSRRPDDVLLVSGDDPQPDCPRNTPGDHATLDLCASAGPAAAQTCIDDRAGDGTQVDAAAES